MMRARLAMAALAAVAGSAADARRPKPTYTRAALVDLTTADLAQRLFGPDVAAIATSHVVKPPTVPGGPLTEISFAVPLRPIGPDLCARDRPSVHFYPVARKRVVPAGDAPSRISYTTRDTRLALAPGCRTATGQRFVVPIPGLPLDRSAELLRSLAAARAAAAAPGPLPFRLTCLDERSRQGDKCGGDPRAVLASIPLAELFRIDRSDGVEDAFIALIGDPTGYDDDVPFWQIELKAMGTAGAEVQMDWTIRTVE